MNKKREVEPVEVSQKKIDKGTFTKQKQGWNLKRLFAKHNTSPKPTTAQQTIPFETMYYDGICKENIFSGRVDQAGMGDPIPTEMVDQPLAETFGPGLLQHDSQHGIRRTVNIADPSRDRTAAFPIKSADDSRAGTGYNCTGQTEKEINRSFLHPEEAEKPTKNTDTENSQTQGPDVLFGRKRFLFERHNHILNKDGPPTVHISIIGRKHRREHHRHKQTEQTGGHDQ